MPRTGFYFDEHCLWHTTGEHALIMPVGGWIQPPAAAGHAESPESKRRFKSLMDVSGLTAQLSVQSAEPVTETDMARVHSEAYLDRFKTLSDAGGGNAGEFSPFGSGSYEIAALSAGLVKRAVFDVVDGTFDNAYALSRPPGHHAMRDGSMGFCLLANIAIAIEAARAERGLTRVAVLDWDVHHGNGTQDIFYEREDVLTISIHQENCFPPGSGSGSERGAGAGEGANLNVNLLPGAGHQSYIDAMDILVLPALHAFRPELIIVACGLDANNFDPLSRMTAHSGTFGYLTRAVMGAANDLCGGRLVCAHEGGYAEAVVPFCAHEVVRTLAGVESEVVDPFRAVAEANQPPADFVAFQRQRLECFKASL
ncbi:class II histone deacetylase [Ruegeria pomeroyi]|nr:class II histone deacetylase [Ruegeria pomeroyi]NVK98117.1 class II histone deacetylase [Ruegeria pomeroyi]NVL02700.1 class II histone deacetylase [Ruegeria pomeroyi]HCE71161.1 class II histone deacetylase [Ruegeria sp.]